MTDQTMTPRDGRPVASGAIAPEPGGPMHTIEDVVGRGMCVGCGACAARTGGAVRVQIGTRRSYEADLTGATPAAVREASRVCPFSDESRNEDAIANDRFAGLRHDPRVGYFSTLKAARLNDESRLMGSSSGGLTSWVAEQLLRRDRVDAVIHVTPTHTESGPMFSYTTSDTPEAFAAERKSMYTATTMADILQAVRGNGKRYAVIGVPCFLRAARLLSEQDAVFGGQLKYFLGLVCGHLKSQAFAESLAWQAGVEPDDLEAVDFRIKVPGRLSSHYDVQATAKDGTTKTAHTHDLVGGNWGHAMFQANACNFCDDIFAETADVAFGDGWLPEYKEEWRGTNVVVSRHPDIDEIFADEAAVWSVPLTVEQVAATQGGNFRHRRIGLSVRLHDDVAAGLSVPRKRVAASLEGIDPQRVELIRLRRRMSEESHEAFAEARRRGSLAYFLRRMRPFLRRYDNVSRGNRLTRLRQRVRRMLR
ncbi:MAG TPA: Coenzyme F420 hydrogenase/dehydrogenase, beta subunit C-terminal domain [Microbacterium sp.]|uniref:Coenzyme F420 hydrogenase/dehydrogenase, beta subunit C-terminal domain n=1 Tax=Microbacterium sp. TaxID=51671 RepID=UPI002BE1AA80|nr:Coenzyme F420 hydrogenase/dehydrogenase, beta subunit C-terminal domain [Microbacterium sp.]HWI31644.1 Coenzyme F420 hydrogenase/dehydrogenase, beta subunit C-terminal domain [Microbacterium sp.]